MITVPRPYQLRDIDRVHGAFASGAQSVCYVLPTGGGKTVVFVEIVRRCAEAGTSSCILVHRDSLLQQASTKLREVGIEHSVIAPGRRHYGDLVTVASVQTLVRRLHRHHFDFLIPDEGHHADAPTYHKIFGAYPDAHILGVTATPWRPNGRGLEKVYQSIVVGPGIEELIRDGYLVEPVAYGAAKPVNLDGLHSRAGDYDQHELAELMDTQSVTGDAVEHYTRLCAGAPAVVFCVSVKHAEDVAAQFAAAGYRATSVSGQDDIHVIRRRTAGLADGSVQVLTSCDLISEGFDAPAVTAAILLRPTKSLVVYLQQVGRALRPVYAPGFNLDTPESRKAAIRMGPKPHAIVLDHAGNSFRFGLADDAREWTLAGRPKRAGSGGGITIPLRQCPKCFRTHRPGPICPECGHIYVVVAEAPDVRDGLLVKIDKDALRRARENEVKAAKTFDDLKRIERARGYRMGWARHILDTRSGYAK